MSRKISDVSCSDYVFYSEKKDKRTYTVDRNDSSISNESTNVEDGNCYALFLCIVKWITAVILSTLVLFCIVGSKICLLALGQHFKSIKRSGNDTISLEDHNVPIETQKQALFLMLLLALMIPQAMSFLYASWTSLTRKSRPWPKKQGFIAILFGGFLETFSLCYITVVVLTVVPINPAAIVLLMCSLSMIPAIWEVFKSRSRWRTERGKFASIMFGSSAVFALIGIVLLLLKIPHVSSRIGIPVALTLLSIAWSPKMRKFQIQSEEHVFAQRNNGVTGYAEEDDVQVPSVQKRNASARGKAAIISSLWSIFLTPLVATFFSKIFHINELYNMSAGFKAINTSNPSFVFFILHVVASFFGYHLGWLSCSLCMQRIAYALPLTLATPIAVLIVLVPGFCESNIIVLPCKSDDLNFILSAGSLLWLSQFFATTYYVWKNKGLIMAKAYDLLWIPSYNGVCLEQYLLLNRRNEVSDEEHITQQDLSSDLRIFICTTMYHEEDYEMEQLLRSIHDVDTHSQGSGRYYESHIFFDGCVRAEKLNSFVVQLASLVEKTLKVPISDSTKLKTPYGMQLRWKLPGGMDFTVHLKDNVKVKNKKRWSQVMYMSYVLDHKEKLLGANDNQCFILTTDADVKFTHESVEALIDQIVEDPHTGAVCARTHPMGNGPAVWYQIFDYAIGHWFQKVSNHMLGSVLCCPGCFSLYRCQAVRDVLSIYATGVDHAFDFLTKDMGEDRWMCTLMIQRGWRLTYCAAAVDSTYCPESFDEFYKQRRRWTPSTLANLVLLIREFKTTLRANEHISLLFIFYQAFLVFSTVIGPSTVILIIVGGIMYSGVNMNEITLVVLICILVIAYVMVCLFTSQTFQLRVSKILTFVFAVIMCIVFIGVAVQVSRELRDTGAASKVETASQPNMTTFHDSQPLDSQLPVSVSSLYLAGLSGMFIAAAILHPKEFTCLLHAVWYLLCLPSGYLLLTIYSLCNLTDRSWGTREGKTVSESEDWYKLLFNHLNKLCICCYQNRNEPSQVPQVFIQEHQVAGSKLHDSSDQAKNKETIVTITEEGTVKTEDAKIQDTKVVKTPDVKFKDARSERPSQTIILYEEGGGVLTTDHENDSLNISNQTVYSADEIPNKKRAINTSRKIKSRESTELTEGRLQLKNSLTLREQAVQTEECLDDQILSFSRLKERSLPQKVEFSDDDVNFPQSQSSSEGSASLSPMRIGNPRSYNSYLAKNGNESKEIKRDPVNIPSQLSEEQGKLENDIETSPYSVSALVSASTSIMADIDGDQKQGSEDYSMMMSFTPLAFSGDRPESALKKEASYSNLNQPVERWLTEEFMNYANNFRQHGYDTVGFLPGMTEKDLENIGIEIRGHRKRLLREIKKIPRVDIEEGIPDNVEEWLKELGLGEYWPTFERSGYKEPSDLEDIKNMKRDGLKETFNIYKTGHFKRLSSAIRKLQYPNQGQKKIRLTRRELDRLPLGYLDDIDPNECAFWHGLRERCLIPELSAFDQTSSLKEKLVELRNTSLVVFAVTNALWIIIILTLVQQKDLKVLGVDVIGLGFLTIYGCIFVIQFLALLGHRFKTVIHVLARTPWKLSPKVGNNRVSSA
ncbi:uncharacterized protein [Montipora capricornis]|uniref:uncharacterized protein n=1 Tax=Montipora capricornis TaxID=246305 RepID=UPI0035F14BFC